LLLFLILREREQEWPSVIIFSSALLQMPTAVGAAASKEMGLLPQLNKTLNLVRFLLRSENNMSQPKS
jgi:hypothetical protein